MKTAMLKVFLVGALLCAAAPGRVFADPQDEADGSWDYDAIAEALKEAKEASPFFEGTVLNPAQVVKEPEAKTVLPEEKMPEPVQDKAQAEAATEGEAVGEALAEALSDLSASLLDGVSEATSKPAQSEQAAEPCDETEAAAQQASKTIQLDQSSYCARAVQECAEVTCRGQQVKENECEETANGISTTCSCGDEQSSFSSSSWGGSSRGRAAAAQEEDPFMNMFARRFGPFLADNGRSFPDGQPFQPTTPSPLDALFGGMPRRPQQPLLMQEGPGPRPMSIFPFDGFRASPFSLFGGGRFGRPVSVVEIDLLPVNEDGDVADDEAESPQEERAAAAAAASLLEAFLPTSRPVGAVSIVSVPRRAVPQQWQQMQRVPGGAMMAREPQMQRARMMQRDQPLPGVWVEAEVAPMEQPSVREEVVVMEPRLRGPPDGPVPGGPFAACAMLMIGLVLMAAATCCCCAPGARRADEDDDYVEVVDVDAYTPLMSQEEAVALAPLAHEEAIREEAVKA